MIMNPLNFRINTVRNNRSITDKPKQMRDVQTHLDKYPQSYKNTHENKHRQTVIKHSMVLYKPVIFISQKEPEEDSRDCQCYN